MEPHEYQLLAEAEWVHPWFVNRRRLVQGLVRRFAAHLRGPRVLDAGCGTGVNLGQYQQFGETLGIEYDAAAAGVCAARGHRRVAVGDLCRLPFRDSSFDLVISTDVIEHIEDDLTALCEMRRVLSSAGRIILTTPAYSWAYSQHDRMLHHVRRYDLSSLCQRFRQAGLQPVHLSRYNVLLAAPVVLFRWFNGRSATSDVGRPVPGPVRALLGVLWDLEARLAARSALPVGLTHVAVLKRR